MHQKHTEIIHTKKDSYYFKIDKNFVFLLRQDHLCLVFAFIQCKLLRNKSLILSSFLSLFLSYDLSTLNWISILFSKGFKWTQKITIIVESQPTKALETFIPVIWVVEWRWWKKFWFFDSWIFNCSWRGQHSSDNFSIENQHQSQNWWWYRKREASTRKKTSRLTQLKMNGNLCEAKHN